ncbi:MAG: aromatic ring-hydroxylating dioxygenase subunit alpha [Gammaproteobacteria bacterium]
MKNIRTLVQQYAADLPLKQASTPPSAWYMDAGVATLEKDAVFGSTWQMVARLDQLQEKGAYVTADVAGEPIVVVKSDAIRAFYNVCRHHGAKVMNGQTGCQKTLTCPYHGWTYSLDGELIHNTFFDEVEGFDKSQNGLKPVRVETWENWVFVNLNPNAPDLKTSFGSFYDRFVSLKLGLLHFWTRREYRLESNWKVFVDNYLDGGYHIPFIHRGLSSVLDNPEYVIEAVDSHCLQACPMAEANTETAKVREGKTAWYVWQYPNFIINAYEGDDGVKIMDTNLVLPDGPEGCLVICDYWYLDVSDSAKDYNDEGVRIADEIQTEDMGICASVQRGLNSRSYDTGRLSAQKEAGEYLFHQLLYKDLIRKLD